MQTNSHDPKYRHRMMTTLKTFFQNHKKKILGFLLVCFFSIALFFSFFKFVVVWVPGWSIGVFESSSNFELTEPVANPIITVQDLDEQSTYFVADPFVFKENGIYYLFFEPGIKTERGRKGVIGLALSDDGLHFEQKGTVLEEDISISFPIVYAHEGAHYMTVEGREARNIRLFKAVNFPSQWELADTLINGNFGDPVIFQKDSLFFLFVSKPVTHDAHLFVSNHLNGPYSEHVKSPINVNNKSTGRMAGNIIQLGNKLYRPVQDCERLYGEQVRLMEIVEISSSNYVEKESNYSPVLIPGREKWNSKKMHTMNIYDKKEDGSFKIITDGDYLDYKPLIRIVKK